MILFCTNNRNTDSLYQWLAAHEKEEVLHYTEKLTLERIQELKPSYMISFNYRYIVKQDVLDYMQGKVINLHCSYLPYNRGSSPNFFSFIENTPKGVTIHKMEAGLDTGDIYAQKELFFDEEIETFATTYDALIQAMTELFIEHWEAIKENRLQPVPQSEGGTYHTMADLNAIRNYCDFEWSETIHTVKERLHEVQ